MIARPALVLALLALFALPACLDPIVGGECKTGYSPCHGVCLPTGTCQALDGSTEAEPAVDGPENETWSGGEVGETDADGPGTSDDAGTAADAESADGAATGDGGQGDLGARDAASGDGPRLADGDLLKDVPDIADVPLHDDSPGPKDLGPILVIDATAPLDGGAGDGDETNGAPVDGEGEGGAGATDDVGATDDGAVTDDAADDSGTTGDAADDSGTSDDAVTTDDAGQDDGGPDAITPPVCTAPEVVCYDRCVDPASFAADPDNCGACGIPCMSGLCSSGKCEAAGTGRAIVIGHDYFRNRSAMNRILGNAVFLWPNNPVRLVVYERWANPTAIAGANTAIAQVATATGRQSIRTAVAAEDVPSALASADVFLIYGQESATDDTLVQLGKDWKTALGVFLQAGGTVVVLDAVYPANAGTTQILSQTLDDGLPKLFDLVRDTTSTGDVCTVIARGDALATGLLRTYLCERNSTSFVVHDTASTVTPVVADGTRTVVVHKVF